MMSRKKESESVFERILQEPPIINTKKIVAIDLLALMEDINNRPPDNLAQLNDILLKQPRYDLIIPI